MILHFSFPTTVNPGALCDDDSTLRQRRLSQPGTLAITSKVSLPVHSEQAE